MLVLCSLANSRRNVLFNKVLAALLAAAVGLPAQQPASLVAQSAGLKIVVVQGEGASNSIRSRSGVAPVVEIRDDSDKPVPGAEVTFQLPLSGPSGFFNGWLRNQTVRSDANGRASATGFTPNDEEGRLNIKVSAVAGTRNASIVIAQSNVRAAAASSGAASSRSKGWWKWAALAGAAAIGGGIYAGTRGDNSTAAAVATRPIVIAPGVISVGVPR
jgi:hypothetical protein